MSGRVHLIGIGGAGLSAIAHVLHDRGETVTGSDRASSAYARALEAEGIQVFFGHSEANVRGADLVIASSAIPDGHVEIVAARQMGIPVIRRKTFLTELTAAHETIAVAGTHGKTTTSGMIAWLLEYAGYDPSFIVGGMLADFGANGKAGTGRHFVVEADEYDRAFLGLYPSIAVITNVEYDHPDCYPTLEDLYSAFEAFIRQVRGKIVISSNDPGTKALARGDLPCITYGIETEAHWRAEEIRPNSAGGMDFLAHRYGKMLGLVRTRLPGKHNVENTLAALAVADEVGVPFSKSREALTGFHGAGQRFEIIGEARGITVVDDYAHHPTEIRATLATARLRFPKSKIWAVFQPHTYSRIRALMAAYITAFEDADHVIITDIFAAREQPNGSISGQGLAQQIQHDDAIFISDFDQAAEQLALRAETGDVIVTLSAGDANRVGRLFLERLRGGEKGIGNE